MPRPRRFRRVRFDPDVTYFKPAGVRKSELDESLLTFDELEAVRLKDLEGLDQIEAARKMDISQPTFHRLVVCARKKIADAIVNGKAIKIEGGKVRMVRGHMRGRERNCSCLKCGHKMTKKRGIPCSTSECPKCGSIMIRGD